MMNFIKKIVRNLIKIFLLLINLLSTPLIVIQIVIYSLVLYMLRSVKEKKSLIIGLEHVINKSEVRAKQLFNKGIEPFFYSFEDTSSKFNSKFKIYKIPLFIIIDFHVFFLLLLKYRPIYIEIYFSGLGVRQFFYIIFSRINSVYSIAILRGELYYYNKGMSIVKKIAIKLSLKTVSYIYYREYYMKDILNKFNISNNKIHFDFNKVVVNNNVEINRTKNIVLFLNGFKKWRNLNLLIDAIPIVLNKIPDVKFLFVGARSDKEFNDVKNQLVRNNKVDFEVCKWTQNPKQYYEIAKIFVLPADLVFLNFSLLEAMEQGVAPIIADVENAEEIIEHGVNGFLCEKNKDSIASYIIKLLNNEEERKKIAINARETVINKFNDSDRMNKIHTALINKYKELFN